MIHGIAISLDEDHAHIVTVHQPDTSKAQRVARAKNALARVKNINPATVQFGILANTTDTTILKEKVAA